MNAHHILVIQRLDIFRETQKRWDKHSFFVIVGKCWSRVGVFDVLGIEVKGCSQMTRLSSFPLTPRLFFPSFFIDVLLCYPLSPLLIFLSGDSNHSYPQPS